MINVFNFDRKPSDQGISSWGWNLNGQHSTYHALFPRAWTVYDGNLLSIIFSLVDVTILAIYIRRVFILSFCSNR